MLMLLPGVSMLLGEGDELVDEEHNVVDAVPES